MTAIKAGDRTEVAYTTVRGTVLAVDGDAAWILDDDGNRTTYPIKNLTLIPPKIAEPPRGEVVWDFYEPAGRRIAWRHSSEKGWTAYYDGLWLLRDWSDFSDDVTLVVDPKAGA